MHNFLKYVSKDSWRIDSRYLIIPPESVSINWSKLNVEFVPYQKKNFFNIYHLLIFIEFWAEGEESRGSRGTYIFACRILQILAWKLVRIPAVSNRSDRTQATLFLLEAQFIHAGPVLLLPFSPISRCCLLEAVLAESIHSTSLLFHPLALRFSHLLGRNLSVETIHKRTIIRLTRISVIFLSEIFDPWRKKNI